MKEYAIRMEGRTEIRQSVNNDNNDEIEIDLLQICRIIMEKLLYIILSGIICGALTLIVCAFIIPAKYESQSQLYIINRQNDGVTTYNDIQSSTQLVKDYKVLVVSRPVLEKVIHDLNLNYKVEELEKCITAGIETDSRVLEITVKTKDPYLSKSIVDSVANVSAEQIKQVMQIEGVNVIQYGQIADEQCSPSVLKDTAIAVIVAMIITAAWFVVIFILDDTIKNSDDIERYLEVSTLALIPYSEESDDELDIKKTKNKKKKRAKR